MYLRVFASYIKLDGRLTLIQTEMYLPCLDRTVHTVLLFIISYLTKLKFLLEKKINH